ncbi:unnamed protein product, partial [Tilletia controversa]
MAPICVPGASKKKVKVPAKPKKVKSSKQQSTRAPGQTKTQLAQQNSSRLPGLVKPETRKKPADGPSVGQALAEMVSAEDRRLRLKQQDELTERKRLSVVGDTTETARIDLERTKAKDVRDLEDRKLAAVETKEAFERDYRQLEREREKEKERREDRW